jgi:leucyl/phenylalanyl-tRNA--protein transferase
VRPTEHGGDQERFREALMVIQLDPETPLPSPSTANANGVVAIGNDLRAERLYEAYRTGIFPWPMSSRSVPWMSPDPRMVLHPGEIRVPRSLRKSLRNKGFSVTADVLFDSVIGHCARAHGAAWGGTWITPAMTEAYIEAHNAGFAHSIEVWQDNYLVGGLYGISIGAMFCGESMFCHVSDASKVAFVTLYRQAMRWGFQFIDCQVHNDHTASLGAREIPRDDYLAMLGRAVNMPGVPGPWQLDVDCADVSDLPPLG